VKKDKNQLYKVSYPKLHQKPRRPSLSLCLYVTTTHLPDVT